MGRYPTKVRSFAFLIGLVLSGCLTDKLQTVPEPMDAGEMSQDLGEVLDLGEAQPDPDLGPPEKDAGQPDAGPEQDLGMSSPDVGFADQGTSSDAGTAPGVGCGQMPGMNDRMWTLTHDGRTREFFVHLPPSYDPNVATPLVFDFHGRLFTATLQMGLTGMRDVADAEGFIVVHPEGIGRTWNGGVCCGEASREDVDDVGFVSAMIDEISASLCIDEKRVYATGMSNGGFMSHRLACELSDRIAAIAPVAGVLGITQCAPARPVPVLHFHGTDDNIVGYNGIRGYLSVADSMEGWVTRNACSPMSTPDFMLDDVRCELWNGCQGGAEVKLCTIDGGGHTWPGGTPIPGLGDTTQTISASQMAWEFFERFTLP